ncbi:MAG: glycosyltransferase family 39 protein [Patescibacteria group bacterium]|nr:glycosyltransferase family 39 protein [Patescibacteria group bacterium]
MSIVFVIVIALLARVTSLNQSLWWDEAINVMAAGNSGFWDLVTKYALADFHPPGYFAILWLWGHIFGFSEISVRLPSVIFGILTVYLTYLIGKKLFTSRVALMGALLMALAPLNIYYSQEARMYSFAAFAATLSIYFLIKLLNREKFAREGYILSIFLVMYSDYIAYLIIPVQIIYIFLYQKDKIRQFLSALGLGLLSVLPWLVIFPQQLQAGRSTAISLPGWKEVVGGANIKTAGLLVVKILIGRISFDPKMAYASVLVLASSPFLVLLLKFRKSINPKTKLLLFWLLIPPLSAFLISFFVPVFSYFRFIFILPAFYLFTAVLINKFSLKWSQILVGFIVFSEIVFSGIYLANSQYQREDWRGAVKFVDQQADNSSIILFENSEVAAPFVYYSSDLTKALPAFKKIPAKTTNDFNDLDKIISGKKNIFMFEYLVDIADPQRLLQNKLNDLGFKESKIYNFQGVGFVRMYTRKL